MATTTAPAASARRPNQALLLGLLLVAALVGLYKVRIEPTIAGLPVGFEDVLRNAEFPNGLPLKTRYIGIPAFDNLFPWLVVSFLTGPAGWDSSVRLQQMYFLYNFAGVLAILVVESRRVGSRRGLITWIAVWGFLYQTVAGAFILPLWFLADLVATNNSGGLFVVADSSSSSSSSSSNDNKNNAMTGNNTIRENRTVQLPDAQSFLPATIMGYLLPTALLYVPWGWPHEVNQLLTAFWQPAPLYTSMFLVLFCSAAKSLSVTSGGGGYSGGFRSRSSPYFFTPSEELPYLKQFYFMVGWLCAGVHFYVFAHLLPLGSTNAYHGGGDIYADLISSTTDGPEKLVSFASVFIPSRDTWKTSLIADLHYIFQWDFIPIFAAAYIWSCVKVCDILRSVAAAAAAAATATAASAKADASANANARITGKGKGKGKSKGKTTTSTTTTTATTAATTTKTIKTISVVPTLAAITLANVLLGPGAALMGVWYWREVMLVHLAQLEEERALGIDGDGEEDDDEGYYKKVQ